MKVFKKLLIALAAVSIGCAYAADGAKMGADRHVSRGVTCQNCHGNDMSKPAYPDRNTCFQCHEEKGLINKTKNLKPTNPHSAPHNNECTLCHMQHEKPVNYCETCHQFYTFKVP